MRRREELIDCCEGRFEGEDIGGIGFEKPRLIRHFAVNALSQVVKRERRT